MTEFEAVTTIPPNKAAEIIHNGVEHGTACVDAAAPTHDHAGTSRPRSRPRPRRTEAQR